MLMHLYAIFHLQLNQQSEIKGEMIPFPLLTQPLLILITHQLMID